jgi:uncharacterized protein (TIRG00374 family)
VTVQRRLFLLQAVISVAALAGVVFWVARQHFPPLPDGGRVASYVVVAIAVYAFATLGRGERWHRLLELTGAHSRRSDAYALTTVGYMGNNTMPARAGDLLKTALTASRTGSRYPEVLGAAVAERVLDAVTLGSVFVVIATLVVHSAAGLPDPRVLAGLAVVLVAALIAATFVVRSNHDHHLVQRAARFIRALGRPSKALVSPQGALLLVASFAIWALEATVYLLLGDGLNLGLNAADALYLVALTNLVALIPAAPGYVGTFDAAVIFGVKALVGGSGATTYAILLRLVLFGPITLVGFVLLVARYGGLSRLRAMRRRSAIRDVTDVGEVAEVAEAAA